MKKHVFDYNSINARVYRWFWFTSNMPNLCPYFWKSVIMWLLMLPTIALTLVHMIASAFGMEKADDWFSRIFGGFFMWLFAFGAYLSLCAITYPLLLWLHSPFAKSVREPALAGTVLLVGVALIFSFFYIKEKIERLRDIRQHKKYNAVPEERTANLLIEGIKSFYHKYCPQIEWKNAPNNN